MEEKLDDQINGVKEYSFLRQFGNVYKFKSLRRAMRRGTLTPYGVAIPRRPYNNRANSSERRKVHSRVFNQEKRRIYAELKKHGRQFDFLY